MLTHIVCWKYKAETTPEMRADHRAKLMALPEIIRNSVSFNVGEDILHLERSFDTGLVAVFTDRAALDFYNDHPEHQKVCARTWNIGEGRVGRFLERMTPLCASPGGARKEWLDFSCCPSWAQW